MNYPCCGAGTPRGPRLYALAHQTTRPRDGARLADGTFQCRAAVRRSPTAAPASSGSKCPDARLSTWVLVDGVAPRTARMTERTGDGFGAADRECLLLRIRLRHAATNPDARSSQMRFVLRLSDPCFCFLFVRSNDRGSPAAAAHRRLKELRAPRGRRRVQPLVRRRVSRSRGICFE